MTQRWNVTIRDETDRLVRSHLARRGFKKGDLSKFVDRALRRTVFWETVDAAQEMNRDADPAQIEADIDAAVAEVRRAPGA